MEQFCPTRKGLRILAPAKVNLSLLVAGKRPDGYHELETIMAKIDYCDEILLEQGTKPGIELVCTGLYHVPDGPDNLVWKACQLLTDKVGKQFPIKVTLTKNIPAGTGLGSGSSDAAATLMGFNRFARFGLSSADLHILAAKLGSDVNFFLEGPLAFCTGRGEIIRPVKVIFPFQALLIIPDTSTSTKEVYKNYTHIPDLYSLLSKKINAFLDKNNVDFAAALCANMLQESCFQVYPQLADIKQKVEELTGKKVCLSGSGSAMYCLIDSQDEGLIKHCCDILRCDCGCVCRLVSNNRW
jgi:4-diphosphocytidyl-2-C-methyl-D-erythritol kinase